MRAPGVDAVDAITFMLASCAAASVLFATRDTTRRDGSMRVRTRIGIGVASAAVLAVVGVGVAVADDGEVTGPAADQARVAAVQAVPGKAGKVERETNEGAAYYGVLVTKADGTQVEVHLDQAFHFVGTEAPDADND
jgi:hypothetical protein